MSSVLALRVCADTSTALRIIAARQKTRRTSGFLPITNHKSLPPSPGLLASDEEVSAVGGLDLSPGYRLAAVFCQESLHRELDAESEIGLAHAGPHQRCCPAGFNRPGVDLAVRPLDVDVQPAVRIDPFELRQGPLQGDLLAGVEFSGE